LYGSIGSVCLLHCVSSYPVASSDARLAWIGGLRKSFGVPAGYSDHTCEPLTGALAVAAGACVIEKHLTHDRGAPGPDHSASFDQRQFAAYVAMIRLAETLRGGDGGREILACERDVRDVSRQSLVARVPIPAGTWIAAEMITTQRPGSGIPAAAIDDVCGRTAACDIDAGAMVAAEMIAGLHLAA
jgi:sialic acid synthase SpsE